MRYDIVPYGWEHADAVKAFNGRLAAAGSRWRFPETPDAPWLRKSPDAHVWQDLYVALQGSDVRGGYMIRSQSFHLRGRRERVASFQLPVSEGIVDAAHAFVGPRLLRDALQRHPLLFGLGMGGIDSSVAKLYRASRFQFATSSLFFRVHHPNRFLREIAALRTTRWRTRVLDLLASSGIGWVGLKSVNAVRRPRSDPNGSVRAELVGAFDSAVDEVWWGSMDAYGLIAERTHATLNAMFPPGDDRFLRMQVWDGHVVGWAVLADTKMSGHRHFGNLRVGTIVDQLALPGYEQTVVDAAERVLTQHDVELVVSNQLNARWERAFERQGFLRGPSNFHLAVSPALADRLAPFATSTRQVHVTRGDGDGPVHLVPGFAMTDPERTRGSTPDEVRASA